MILFEELTFKNILSYGNTPTTVNLREHQLTTIRGRNSAGKSTILEAICFVLFGKTFRKMAKPDLVNDRNQKDLLVEIKFSIGEDRYVVRRGIKPTIFEVIKNDVLVNQNSSFRDYQDVFEKTVLQIDYLTFIQIVIVGKASYTSFMKLNSDQRRKFIENILGLNIFAVMSDIHKVNVNVIKKEVSDFKNKFILLKEKIKIQERFISELRKTSDVQRQESENRLAQQVKHITEEIEELERLIKLEKEKIEPMLFNSDDLDKKLLSIKDLIRRSTQKIKDCEKDITFFSDNDNCPVCSQTITEELRLEKINGITSSSSSIEVALLSLREREKQIVDDISRNTEILSRNNRSLSEIDRLVSLKNSFIAQKEKLCDDSFLQNSSNLEEKIEVETKTLLTLLENNEAMLKEKEDLMETLARYEIISLVLGDNGIKKTILRQYLPIVNKTMNKYLQEMNFAVKFEIDENFNEVINIRGRDSNYSRLSEGERQKIDLCALLAWKSVAQLRARFNSNLLIFDEIEAGLDPDSIDYFVQTLKRDLDKNVFVITHREDWEKYSDCRINISRKSSGFSQMQKVLDTE